MEIAESYVEASKDKLKLVGVLELEFEVFNEVESNIKPPKVDSKEDGDDTIEEFSAGESTQELVRSRENNGRNISEVNVIGGSYEQKSFNKEFGKEDKEVPDATEEVVKKVEYGTGEKKVQVGAKEEDDATQELPLSLHLSVPMLVTMMLVLVLVLVAVYRICCRKRDHQLGSCEVGYGDKSRLLARKGYKSPKLDVVNEDSEWNRNAVRAKSSRRKRM